MPPINRKYPRAKWHDYNEGIYFVTVVTKNHTKYFGDIKEGELRLNLLGQALHRFIDECGNHYPDVIIHSQIVMPNHFHAIIEIIAPNPPVGSRHAAAQSSESKKEESKKSEKEESESEKSESEKSESSKPTASEHTSPTGCLHPPRQAKPDDNFDARNHHNARLSVAVGGIKSALTRFASKNNIVFLWQKNMYDHIIRNQREYELIDDYIRMNPKRWATDKFNANS